MNETWNVWLIKDRKVLLTNVDAPLANGEAIAIDKDYVEARSIAKKLSLEKGLDLEIEDTHFCEECGCYDGWHADYTECQCSCCCALEEDEEEEWLEEWEDC